MAIVERAATATGAKWRHRSYTGFLVIVSAPLQAAPTTAGDGVSQDEPERQAHNEVVDEPCDAIRVTSTGVGVGVVGRRDVTVPTLSSGEGHAHAQKQMQMQMQMPHPIPLRCRYVLRTRYAPRFVSNPDHSTSAPKITTSAHDVGPTPFGAALASPIPHAKQCFY